MEEKCRLIQILRDMAESEGVASSGGGRSPAVAILNIIRDIEADGARSRDMIYLADLVADLDELTSTDTLLAYLKTDATDCHICGALAKQLGIAAS